MLAKSQESDLTVAHLRGPFKHLAPRCWAEERQQSFGHEHQRERAEQQVPHAARPGTAYRRAGCGACGAVGPTPRRALKNSLLGSTTITSDRLRKLAR